MAYDNRKSNKRLLMIITVIITLCFFSMENLKTCYLCGIYNLW